MSRRFFSRAATLSRALVKRLASGPRAMPAAPRRVLIAHHLLLGDTLMLTPLLAKLRTHYPASEIIMTVPPAFAPLYQSRPYGARVLPFSPRMGAQSLFNEPPFDWAIVPGDNRYSWLAQALDARWITAFARDTPGYKNWLVDEALPFPTEPAAWGDMAAELVAGTPPAPYSREQWLSPAFAQFDAPQPPYCVLHVGASSARKLWPAEHWHQLAEMLVARGLQVVWSAGSGEQALVAQCDPAARFPSYAGKLDLAQLWNLVENAALLVAPDTGVAHLGKVTATPTVTLFGPGPTRLYGAGEFWKNMPYLPVVLDDLPARNQPTLFRRALPWLKGDGGRNAPCAEPRAVYGRGFACVATAVSRIIEPGRDEAWKSD